MIHWAQYLLGVSGLIVFDTERDPNEIRFYVSQRPIFLVLECSRKCSGKRTCSDPIAQARKLSEWIFNKRQLLCAQFGREICRAEAGKLPKWVFDEWPLLPGQLKRKNGSTQARKLSERLFD
jgi:hypothetical protein